MEGGRERDPGLRRHVAVPPTSTVRVSVMSPCKFTAQVFASLCSKAKLVDVPGEGVQQAGRDGADLGNVVHLTEIAVRVASAANWPAVVATLLPSG